MLTEPRGSQILHCRGPTRNSETSQGPGCFTCIRAFTVVRNIASVHVHVVLLTARTEALADTPEGGKLWVASGPSADEGTESHRRLLAHATVKHSIGIIGLSHGLDPHVWSDGCDAACLANHAHHTDHPVSVQLRCRLSVHIKADH